MKKIEDLHFTESMSVAREVIEGTGLFLEGWDEFDCECLLAFIKGVILFGVKSAEEYGRGISGYLGVDGRVYVPYNTLYLRGGGKKKACMIFGRAGE